MEEGAMAGKRILIVEDENITALDIRQTVQELGYEPVGLVAYGKDAIKHALTLHPDLILMDILLKGPIDGIQAAAAIRSQYPCPVIYLTAHADQSTIDRAKATEPAGYVLKPINDRELHAAIELALRRDTNGGTAERTQDMVRITCERRHRQHLQVVQDCTSDQGTLPTVMVAKGDWDRASGGYVPAGL
jgi:DNA-binding NarL/FixJ family response regulator